MTFCEVVVPHYFWRPGFQENNTAHVYGLQRSPDGWYYITKSAWSMIYLSTWSMIISCTNFYATRQAFICRDDLLSRLTSSGAPRLCQGQNEWRSHAWFWYNNRGNQLVMILIISHKSSTSSFLAAPVNGQVFLIMCVTWTKSKQHPRWYGTLSTWPPSSFN